jgi:hypothetical protein
MSRKVQHRVNTMSSQHFHYEVAIADLSDDERSVEDSLLESRGQIVEHHHLLTAGPQLQDHVASDVTCPAGD